MIPKGGRPIPTDSPKLSAGIKRLNLHTLVQRRRSAHRLDSANEALFGDFRFICHSSLRRRSSFVEYWRFHIRPFMDPNVIQQRLSQISTTWTLVARASDRAADGDTAALAVLVERYQTAVYRYLLAAVRDPDVADELFQDFALRLVRGDFRRADPGRGRFRDYVKSALINLVINHQKKQKKMAALDPAAAAPVVEPPERFDADEEFLTDWRKALLDKAWEALAAAQEPGGPPYHTALRYHSEHACLTGAQLAERLNTDLRPAEPFTEAGLRKVLQRAREKFADLLVEEVVRSLQSTCLDDVQEEIIDLGFHSYCRRAIARRWGG
jgi:RNA polymerase sigma factor (sigma-70 family)